MEGLLEQERELELQIDTYKAQLKGVEAQLENGGQEIQQLHDDLSQLITLTEESLVELKKQRLLFMLHPTEGEREEQVGVAGTGGEREEEEIEDSGGVVGMKCRAPLKESWGSVNYHNAMVLCVELQDEEQQKDSEVKVRVLFTQPLYVAMKPCPFFMEGSCKFSEENCKFSHGLVVPVSQLHSYDDHDYSKAHVGGKCLAKHSDDLWHPALIRSMGEQFTVHYSDLNLQAELPPDSVYPLESSDDSDSVSSDSDIDAVSDAGDGGDGVEGVRVLGWEPRGSRRPLGEWEKHTTGFGSKLLAKMGYVPGQGLGKSSQGRVEPVEIVILPPGKSLDVCAEMRERKKLRGVDTERQRKRRRKREKAAEIKAANEEQKMDMFDFLNTKIFKKMNSGQEGGATSSQQKQAKGTSSSGKSDNLNVRLFKVQEEIKTVKKRRLSLQQALKRHQGKSGDKQMEGHVMEKLSAVERQLTQLQREEQTIEKNITSKTERRKLSVF